MDTQTKELHRVTVTAVIIKDNRYLITKRSPKKIAWPGLWTVPGGGVEVSDYENSPKTKSDCWYYALANALKREVREEVNLEIGEIKYLLDIAFIRPDGIPVITLSFYCNWESGEVKLNEENIDFRWATFEEAKNYELIPGILGELEMVDRILKGENLSDIKYNPDL